MQLMGNGDNANLANNDYLGPGANKADAAEAKVQGMVGGADGTTYTVASFRARIATAPGVGKSWTFTVRKNGSNQAMVCSITGTATQCASATSFSVTAGDLLSVQVAAVNTPAGTSGVFVTWQLTP
jgi:hypothetical protein